MKTLIKILPFILIFCIVLGYNLIASQKIELGDITWKKTSNNTTQLYHYDNLIIKENGIELWADYPYLYGLSNKGWFVYNLDNRKIIFNDSFSSLQKNIQFPTKNGKTTLEISKKTGQKTFTGILVTFETLKGQWADKDKLKELRMLLNKD